MTWSVIRILPPKFFGRFAELLAIGIPSSLPSGRLFSLENNRFSTFVTELTRDMADTTSAKNYFR